MKLFEKIKTVINTLINKQLKKIIFIYNNLTNEILLSFLKASIISRLKIINFIELNKNIRFYLDYSNKYLKDKSIVIIKFDEKMQISLFKKIIKEFLIPN